MSARYIYLKTEESIPRSKLSKVLTMLRIEDYDIEQRNNVFVISLYKGEDSLIKLQNSFRALSEDLGVDLKGLIVPKPHPAFIKYVDSVHKAKMMYAFELGLTDKAIYRDSLNIIKPFDAEMLVTIKAYIEYGNSPTVSSQRLFVHRNTVTYRINQFGTTTDIDLSSFPNCVFIIELIRERQKECPEEFFRE